MIVEMGCLILGVPVGFLLRRKPLVIKITDQVLTWSVRILLLLLGLALGADDRLMSQMDTIGAPMRLPATQHRLMKMPRASSSRS